ncbi:unnamed protein product [Protopolystoma xenopodis]|uniref:Uncharacterized protein n=1 Tax=Protopolystoma xenopodis TaxID=117903 RepID=A0A448WZI8_9PLAT|nr:unnamed protein product [Protopolystoma xenopodis]
MLNSDKVGLRNRYLSRCLDAFPVNLIKKTCLSLKRATAFHLCTFMFNRCGSSSPLMRHSPTNSLSGTACDLKTLIRSTSVPNRLFSSRLPPYAPTARQIYQAECRC